MKNLRLSETINTILSMTCSTIPVFISTFVTGVLELNKSIELIFLFAGYIIAVIAFPLLHHCLPKLIKPIRPLHKYEGYWLQIIPALSERPYTVLDFSFSSKHKGYYLSGTNYSGNFVHKVDFEADKFVETTTGNGFYYITNTTADYKNGFGKVSFVNSHSDRLTRAKGFFFDSSNEACSKKYETILIKCDKEFFKHFGKGYEHINIKRLNPEEIMGMSKDFVQKELENYEKDFPEKCKKFNDLPCITHSKDTLRSNYTMLTFKKYKHNKLKEVVKSEYRKNTTF